MKIDIYTSTTNGNKFISVPAGTKIESLELPDSVDQDILTLSPFRTRLEINLGKPRTALDQEDVMKQITENGYAIHDAKIELKIVGAQE